MKKSRFLFLGWALGGLALAGCGDTNQAQTTLAKFDHVFQVCKEETLKKKLDPGKHSCSLVSSVALDKTLRDTGIGDGKLVEMRDAWLEQKGYKDFYIPEGKR